MNMRLRDSRMFVSWISIGRTRPCISNLPSFSPVKPKILGNIERPGRGRLGIASYRIKNRHPDMVRFLKIDRSRVCQSSPEGKRNQQVAASGLLWQVWWLLLTIWSNETSVLKQYPDAMVVVGASQLRECSYQATNWASQLVLTWRPPEILRVSSDPYSMART